MSKKNGSGNNVVAKKKITPHFHELSRATHRSRSFDGRVYDEFYPQLSGTRAYRTYREMRTDPILGGILLSIEMVMRQVSWWWEPAGKEKKYVKAAEFMHESMDDMESSWHDTVIEIMSMMPFGFSLLEPVYKYRRGYSDDPDKNSKFTDGKIAWRDWVPVDQASIEKWEFVPGRRRVAGIWQFQDVVDPQGPVSQTGSRFIPAEKLLHFRTTPAGGAPEGRSIFRNAYREWYLKRKLQEIEGIGIERELAGLPKMVAPEGMDIWDDGDDQMVRVRREAEELLSSITRNEAEGALMPFGWELDLLSTGGTRAIDPSKTIERYARESAMSTLHDFIVVGHESVGSYAMVEIKVENAAAAVGAWMDGAAAVIQQTEVPRLMRFNQGFPQDKLPILKHSDTKKLQPEIAARVLDTLARAGMLRPTDRDEAWIRSTVGMPEPTPEEKDEQIDLPLKTRIEAENEVQQTRAEQAVAGVIGGMAEAANGNAAQTGAVGGSATASGAGTNPKANGAQTKPAEGSSSGSSAGGSASRDKNKNGKDPNTAGTTGPTARPRPRTKPR